MSNIYTSAFLRDEIAKLIAPSIEWRRQARRDYGQEVNVSDSSPVEAEDVDDFILNCWTFDPPIVEALLDIEGTYDFDAEEIPDLLSFAEFQEIVEQWTTTSTWLGGDGGLILDNGHELPFWSVMIGAQPTSLGINHYEEKRYDQPELSEESIQSISILAPHLGILQKLADKAIDIDNLRWRELENSLQNYWIRMVIKFNLVKVARMAAQTLLPLKRLRVFGFFKGVWQAKKLRSGKKVGIGVIRELADTRQEMKASKGIIVTSTFLTREAIKRVKRDSLY
jgi:hypothetical protein